MHNHDHDSDSILIASAPISHFIDKTVALFLNIDASYTKTVTLLPQFRYLLQVRVDARSSQ